MCVNDTGPLYENKGNLLTSDKLEMCTILVEQFNSVLLHPSQTSRRLILSFLLNQLYLRMMKYSLLISLLLNLSLSFTQRSSPQILLQVQM